MKPGRILIGTSGYVYRDWRERFYPRTLPAREWLPFYAARFPTLELNNSFYRLPTTAMFRAWRRATREDYVFVLEVRHPSWLEPSMFDRLRAAGVSLCIHDSKKQAVTSPVTADFVYVRRHGYGKIGSYPRRAIEADARAIRAWQHNGLDVYVYFNNDWKGFAIRNAVTRAEVLGVPLGAGIGGRGGRLVYRERSGRPVGRKKELKAA